MPTLLSPEALARDLALRDLTDPAAGPHALQRLIDDLAAALTRAWSCDVRVVRAAPIVSVDDNYDRLGFPPGAVTRDARYSRYVSDTCLLRTHTSAVVPPALRALAGEIDDVDLDVLLVCPGVVYRRDAIDRLHTGTPHQLDLWRITTRTTMTTADLDDMIARVVAAALPGSPHRTNPADHPYTTDGREVEAEAGGEWVEIGECGLAAPGVLAGAGLDTGRVTGLAMGLGLDRLLMLRKGIPDIRLLRSSDPRVTAQLVDLDEPYRAVSSHPAIVRDVSLAVDVAADPEGMGDRVREALGDDADAVEDLLVLSDTAGADLPEAARARLGLDPARHKNLLLRVVLRRVDRTLTDAEANGLRDRVYGALHEGSAHQWAVSPGPAT